AGRVAAEGHAAKRRRFVAAIHVDRAARAPVAGIAARAGGGVVGQRAVDEREVAVEAADRAAIAGRVAGKRAPYTDGVAAAEAVDGATRDGIAGRGDVVVLEDRIEPGQAAAVAIDGAASLRGVDADCRTLAVAKRQPLHDQPGCRKVIGGIEIEDARGAS